MKRIIIFNVLIFILAFPLEYSIGYSKGEHVKLEVCGKQQTNLLDIINQNNMEISKLRHFLLLHDFKQEQFEKE